jgi:hypothetical protein
MYSFIAEAKLEQCIKSVLYFPIGREKLDEALVFFLSHLQVHEDTGFKNAYFVLKIGHKPVPDI